jgi:hypothetical protein
MEDFDLEVTECLAGCSMCPGAYVSDLLRPRILCCCICHQKRRELGTSNPSNPQASFQEGTGNNDGI